MQKVGVEGDEAAAGENTGLPKDLQGALDQLLRAPGISLQLYEEELDAGQDGDLVEAGDARFPVRATESAGQDRQSGEGIPIPVREWAALGGEPVQAVVVEADGDAVLR